MTELLVVFSVLPLIPEPDKKDLGCLAWPKLVVTV
jgi:hypothetical protein